MALQWLWRCREFIPWVKENDSHSMVNNAVGKPAYKRDDDNDDTEGV